ncbi:F-box/LRR-repeat protein 2 [Pistacia vera]|uniref:F-box/LRR-repeat protein 2 n=1 Tax=Pistacia vera TaxID=55513 RepID=UPI0012638123|nr:F-box/LRR-repeat protein 2 [Pistacia vera]
MDAVLCDELLQEIFTRLPAKPSSSSSSSSSLSVCLVSKRWLHLYRTSRTSLSLKLIPHNSVVSSLSSFLSHYPSLSSLSLAFSSSEPITTTTSFCDSLLLVVSSSCNSKLKLLRFLGGPVSVNSLLSLSRACNSLTSITVSVSRPLFLNWVASFSCLKELSLYACDGDGIQDGDFDCYRETGLRLSEEIDAELGLESLSLSGIRSDDFGVGLLWRSCKRLKKLQLKSCSGIGDGGSFSSFMECLQGLQEVELRTCRSIVDVVLLKLAENCDSLISLLVYDGCSRDGLLHFMSNRRCNLQNLDLRLPLDLSNDHLTAVAVNFRCLSTLRLQSCCLVTGDGLKTLGIARSSGLVELALINCDVVEREPGLLATLGQNLRQLRKLDLSYNEMLLDKEFIAMLVSCNYLMELKLRGCKRLTNMTVASMSKICKRLESIDLMHCCGIEAKAVESFVLNSPQLRRVEVEENKLSDAARTWASRKFIEVVV